MTTPERLELALYCTNCMPGYHLPLFAGGSEDIFERHGLRVRIVDPAPGPANPAEVAAGERDFCLTSVAHFLAARRADPQLGARFVFMVARRCHMAAFVVRDRPAAHGRPIRTHADLDGASLLGDPELPFGREYRTFLRRLGAAPAASRAASGVAYEQIMEALAAGRGDVAADFTDLLPKFQAAADPFGVRVEMLPFHEAGLDVYGSGLVTSTRLLRERPDTVRATIAAFREALLASREEPRLGLEALLDHIPDAKADLVLAGWDAGVPAIFDAEPSALGSANEDKWRRTIAFFGEAYGGPTDVPVDEVFDDSAFAPAGAGSGVAGGIA